MLSDIQKAAVYVLCKRYIFTQIDGQMCHINDQWHKCILHIIMQYTPTLTHTQFECWYFQLYPSLSLPVQWFDVHMVQYVGSEWSLGEHNVHMNNKSRGKPGVLEPL